MTEYQLGDYVRIHDHDGAEITVKITDSGIPNRQGDFAFKAGARIFKNSEILGLGEVPVVSEKKFEVERKFEIGEQVMIEGTRRAVVIDFDPMRLVFPYRVQYSGGSKEWVAPLLIKKWAGDYLNPAPDTEVHADLVAENDAINSPAHYTSDPSGVECIQITRHRNFAIGSAIKYLWRAGRKSEEGKTSIDKQIEDLNKSIWYIQDEINRLKSF